MLALSIEPHWAWAIIHGDKRIENRTWRTNHRGPLLIHASRTVKNIKRDRHMIPDLPDSLTLGAIIGIVEVIDCVPFSQVEGLPYASGPHCWRLADPVAITPIKCQGFARFFHVTLPRHIQKKLSLDCTIRDS